MNILNIEVKGLKKGKPKLITESGFSIKFYKDKNLLHNLDEYNRFIKGVESIVRSSKEYKQYKGKLMELGFDHCFVMPNIKDGDAPIEMHHGPILTLYDYCSIVTNHLILNEANVTSFAVADVILQEHFQHNVQVVMLCETAHEAIDTGELFLNVNQGVGNLANFLDKYSDGLTDPMKRVIRRYLELCQTYDSTDNGLLDVEDF